MSYFNKAKSSGLIHRPQTTIVADSGLVPLGEIRKPTLGGGVQTIKKLVPAWQLQTINMKRDSISIAMTPPPNTNLFTTSQLFTYLFQPIEAQQITGMRLQLQVRETGGANSVNVTALFLAIQWLQIWSNGGSGDLLAQWYGENLWTDLNLYLSNQQFLNMCPFMGLTSAFNVSNSGSSSMNLSANGYQNISIPIFGPFDVVKPVLNQLKETLQFRLQSRNAVISGTGVLAVSQCNLVFDHLDLGEDSVMAVRELYYKNAPTYKYLDRMNISYTTTFTASTQTRISLQQASGIKVAFGYFMLRSSVSANSNGYMTLASLGSQNLASQVNVQLQDEAGNDMLNHGQGLSLSDIALMNGRKMQSNSMFLTNQNIYPIFFCRSMSQALSGSESSGFQFFPSGNAWQLAVTPSSDFASGSYTLDLYLYYYKQVSIVDGYLRISNY